MPLNKEQFRFAEELYFELERTDAATRQQRLDELRAEQPEVVECVLDMLANPSDSVSESTAPQDNIDEELARTLPNFRLLTKLGEGGMGVVYEAEQLAPVRRRVAIKLIKGGSDSQAVIARFESERQTLAMMDHPNVARVYEAGTTEDGRPYFAMERVLGVPITKYADDARLATVERLQLFSAVCRAVQHAHRKGILHRDLKPSNILVMEQEGAPVVKIIDFGIAKAIAQVGGLQTLFTMHGQLIGTPEYMSPEQLDGQELDTRSDVYALGVLMFELLVGDLPLPASELRAAGLEELRDQLRTFETPKPSERVATTVSGSQDAADHRRTDPRSLERELRGDLDWIALKALAKERDQRYESASELAAEVDRYLNNEPILAGPPSMFYRARKFFRRHRMAAGVAAAVVLAVAFGIAGLVLGLVRAWEAEDALRREADTTQQVLQFMRGVLAQGARAAGQGQILTTPELFEKARQRLRENPPEDPIVRAMVLNRLGEFHHIDLQDFDEAERLFSEAETLLRDSDSLGEELATALFMQGVSARLKGNIDEAQALQDEALRLRRAQLGEESEGTAAVLSEMAYLQFARGESDSAIKTMRRSLEIVEATLDPDHQEVASQRLNLATMLGRVGLRVEAEVLNQKALASARRAGLKEMEAMALNNLGANAYATGRLSDAVAFMEEAYEITRDDLGGDPFHLQLLLSNRGMMLAKKGDFEGAANLLQQSLAKQKESSGTESPAGSAVRQLLAEIYLKGGDYEAARRQIQGAIDLVYRVPPQAPPVSPLRAERLYALIDEAQGNVPAARRRLARAANQTDWQRRDPEGQCLLLIERARLEEDSSRAKALFDQAAESCDSDFWSSSRSLYCRAIFHARHSTPEDALVPLEQLAEGGFVDAWPAIDPALARLRGSPGFEAFVERVRPQ